MEKLARGVVGQFLHEAENARPFVRGQHGMVHAELFHFLFREAWIRGPDERGDDGSALWIRNAEHEALGHLGMLVQDGFHLHGIDVLAG